jgi:hypothetical protein
MLRKIAIALAATSRVDVASILTAALALTYSGFGARHSDGPDSDNPASQRPCDELPCDQLPCEKHGNHATTADRFPGPWRIVEIANGCVVSDAAGQQIGVFYGRDDSNAAGHTGYLTLGEAKQLAADFVRLPELLKREQGS